MQSENNYRPLTARKALQLAAPHTWAASLCPSLFGVTYASLKGFPPGIFRGVSLVAACVLLQSAVNTLNDYVDFVKGTDSAADNVEESDAVLIYGGIRPESARNLGLIYLAAGLLSGLAASYGAGPVPLCIGAVGALTVLLYSGGPLPVSFLPIGEAVSGFVMGGLIPLGAAAASDGRLHPELLFYSLPFILGIGLIMMSNNGCDIEKDLRAGRRTLPSVLGRERTLKLYRFLTVLWIILLFLLPVVLTGKCGLLCGGLLLLFAGKRFRNILTLKLLPEQRVRQMKGIAAANMTGNGAYIAAVALAALLQSLKA